MDSVNNNSSNAGLKIVGGAALAGGVIDGGFKYYKQKSVLAKPDEFIKSVEAEVAQKRKFNTPCFTGTQEAADAANELLDKYLAEAKAFIEGGKVKWGTVLKSAGLGALVTGAGAAVIYGIVKLCKNWGHKAESKIKEHQIEVISEGLKQANAENVKQS